MNNQTPPGNALTTPPQESSKTNPGTPPATPPAEPKAAKAAKPDGPPKRYAAFNNTLGKFFGGVRDARKEAADLVKAAESQGYDAEIREV